MNPVTLPAGTTIGRSYEHGIDVNLGTEASPVWQPCRRISAFAPSPTARLQDAQTYDDLGADNQEVVGWSWALAFNIQGNRSESTGLYLPEIEALFARTEDAKGSAAVIEVRWYHKPETGTPNPNAARHGFANVAYTRVNTGPGGEVETFAITLTGKGSSEKIANPFAGWGVTTPVLATVTPPSRPAGQQVTITGTNLLGATDVKFGTTSATAITPVNSSTVVAVVPAGTAGTVNVTVVTPAGTSAAVPYVRGA